MTVIDLKALPHLTAMFERLRTGHHLCADDGSLYYAIRTDFSLYQTLFAALGFELIAHPRDFYYFRSSGELGKLAEQLVVFFLVLLEAWGDAGHDLETTVFAPNGHSTRELPHLERESWRQYMAAVDITNEDELGKVIKQLLRLGFAARIDDDRFQFRTPVWRFFDFCLDVLDRHNAHEADQPDHQPNQPGDDKGANL